jgi:hypothetical protein
MATKKTDTIPATPTPEPKVRRAAKAKAETLVSDPATRAGKLRPPAPPEPSLMDEKEDPRDLIDRALKTLKATCGTGRAPPSSSQTRTSTITCG